MQPEKKCKKCGQEKQMIAFYTDNSKKDHRSDICRKCYSEKSKSLYWNNPEKYLLQQKTQREKNREKEKDRCLRNLYGISLKIWQLTNKYQEEKCIICQKKTTLVVDHNHKTKEVRGLLCHKCNRGLGHFDDDINLLKRVIKYLEDPIMLLCDSEEK